MQCHQLPYLSVAVPSPSWVGCIPWNHEPKQILLLLFNLLLIRYIGHSNDNSNEYCRTVHRAWPGCAPFRMNGELEEQLLVGINRETWGPVQDQMLGWHFQPKELHETVVNSDNSLLGK